jgi:two-component system response regulator (stage 0 sporulation protein F)
MKARVLIVEDDAVFRRGLARMFSEEECEVAQASDGEQAMKSISSAPPDLVICDLRLPGIDGLGVLSHLKRTRAYTPFILVTAYGSQELIETARTEGATDVLEKPIELRGLKRRCEEMLRKDQRLSEWSPLAANSKHLE